MTMMRSPLETGDALGVSVKTPEIDVATVALESALGGVAVSQWDAIRVDILNGNLPTQPKMDEFVRVTAQVVDEEGTSERSLDFRKGDGLLEDEAADIITAHAEENASGVYDKGIWVDGKDDAIRGRRGIKILFPLS